jgi:hypothetical protein
MAGAEARDVENVGYQLLHAFRARGDVCEEALALGRARVYDRVLQQADRRPDRGEWRAQLVTYNAEQLGAKALELRQLGLDGDAGLDRGDLSEPRGCRRKRIVALCLRLCETARGKSVE